MQGAAPETHFPATEGGPPPADFLPAPQALRSGAWTSSRRPPVKLLTQNFRIPRPARPSLRKRDPGTQRAPLGPREPARGLRGDAPPRTSPHGRAGRPPPQAKFHPRTRAQGLGGENGKNKNLAPLHASFPRGRRRRRRQTVSNPCGPPRSPPPCRPGAGISALAFPAPFPTPSAAAGGAPLPWRHGDLRQPPSGSSEAATSGPRVPRPPRCQGARRRCHGNGRVPGARCFRLEFQPGGGF